MPYTMTRLSETFWREREERSCVICFILSIQCFFRFKCVIKTEEPTTYPKASENNHPWISLDTIVFPSTYVMSRSRRQDHREDLHSSKTTALQRLRPAQYRYKKQKDKKNTLKQFHTSVFVEMRILN
uniref:Uncharacterized protein n=1 Tax=Bombyx mori TaxID=7091 RepID=A0A8R2DLZ1_BOMMO|nr:uncharacterized protein LOC110385843 [Bombyx mori]